MSKTILAALGLALGMSAMTPVAHADPTKKDNNYGYTFDDDLLKGGNNSATGAQITVLKLGRRDRLLRPRVQFVTEMLKSVENL
jgi:hypothetical protein